MENKISPFLMFDGQAKEAMDLYISLFSNSEIVSINYHENSEEKVQYAIFTLHGQQVMCIDSSIKHDFSFTPASSLYIVCETIEEIETLYKKLSKDGEILMKLDSYGFSTQYAWLKDRFGDSWQLNFE